VLVARRFVFFDFNLKAEALILVALASRTKQRKWPNVVLCLPDLRFLSHRSFRMTRGTAGAWRKRGNHTRRLYCLPPGIATCYPPSVNRNIFYVIGVIVVIVIVLKVLHVF